MILGVDEVGRGCWAGPLVAGAVLLQKPIPGLRDSKKLTKLARVRLDKEIREKAATWSLGWVTAAEIDTLGLTEAVRLAMHRALQQIIQPYEELIVDGNYNFCANFRNSRALIGADNLVPAVSAASIIAKVARDQFMAMQAKKFAGYGFESHVGYGTAAHAAALQQLGICELHRRCFRPVQKVLKLSCNPILTRAVRPKGDV